MGKMHTWPVLSRGLLLKALLELCDLTTSCEEGIGDALIRDVPSPLIAELFCDPSLGLNEHIIDW